MKKAEQLLNKISECQRELSKIQDNCCHSKKEVKFISSSVGVRWVCKNCKSLLGWPSQSDVEKWSSK